MTRRVAARADPVVAEIRARIRASPVVHADETGWREGGAQRVPDGYVWTLSTPAPRYFVRGKREKAVLLEALGDAFAGVRGPSGCSDFYAAYTNDDGRRQYCWARLLRDTHDLAIGHPQVVGVRGWADAVHGRYERARAFASEDPGTRRRAARAFQAELRALCTPYLPLSPPGAAGEATSAPPPPRTLCQRIEQHLPDLFVFVEDPAVPSTNNAAARSLRHLVVSRKISGGTRSPMGSRTKMRLATLFGTWRAQGLNPFDDCRNLLATPQV